jgi:hypothetical protein
MSGMFSEGVLSGSRFPQVRLAPLMAGTAVAGIISKSATVLSLPESPTVRTRVVKWSWLPRIGAGLLAGSP